MYWVDWGIRRRCLVLHGVQEVVQLCACYQVIFWVVFFIMRYIAEVFSGLLLLTIVMDGPVSYHTKFLELRVCVNQ